MPASGECETKSSGLVTTLESLTNKKVADLAQATTIQESEQVTLSGLPAHGIKTTGGIIDNPGKQV